MRLGSVRMLQQIGQSFDVTEDSSDTAIFSTMVLMLEYVVVLPVSPRTVDRVCKMRCV